MRELNGNIDSFSLKIHVFIYHILFRYFNRKYPVGGRVHSIYLIAGTLYSMTHMLYLFFDIFSIYVDRFDLERLLNI